MIKKILYFIVIIIVLFVCVGFFLPRNVHVERSTRIDRPIATVFTLVNGYSTFNNWSPWAERDPSAVFETTGPASGVGAHMEWDGDPRLSGKGTQEIIESVPFSLVRTRLEFDQQGEANAYFALNEVPGGTQITWGFDSDLTAGQSLITGLLARYFGLLFDRWIGGDYETGLANLKTFAESLPDVDFSDLEVEVIDVDPVDILFIESDSTQEPANIAEAMAAAYREILDFMTANQVEMTAQPITITRAWNETGYAFDAAIPVNRNDVEPSGRVQVGKSPSGRAVRVVHHGPYDRMMPTYEKLSAYMAAHGLEEGPVSWEQYISDPGETAPQDLVTHIYFLIGN